MRIALLSDIHANREAFEACLAAAGDVDRIVLLGDIVGYGADPAWCTDKAREIEAAGGIVIKGNHDAAAVHGGADMNPTARIAIDWTRAMLSDGQKAWLDGLPLSVTDEDRLYVHAEGSDPARWMYVTDTTDAGAHFAGTSARVSFCGHIHLPSLYCLPQIGKVTKFVPNSDTPIPLLAQRRWLAVMGAVGQPRDGNPAAAFAVYDTDRRELRYRRAPYDVEKAQEKIRAAGLPESLASRLSRGH